ncbi:MAG: bacillithiol biosynthesis deacetylase BshB1 [Planctomycetota bacterium]
MSASSLPSCDVLAFGPHPDDVEIACGGAMILLQQAGRTTAVVDLTRGEMGSRGSAEERTAEASAAATALKLTARANLGLPDTGVRDDDGSTDLVVAALRAARPALVFAPHERDVHPDHSNAARLIGRAHFLAGLRRYRPDLGEAHRARTMLRYPGNLPVEPALVVDISAVAEQKLAAVRCYASQLSPPDTSHLTTGLDLLDRAVVRQRAMGARIAAAAGEGFCHEGPVKVSDVGWLTS